MRSIVLVVTVGVLFLPTLVKASSLTSLSVGVVGTLPVGTNPDAVAVDPTTHMLYVANSGSNTVSIVDGETLHVTATVPVGTGPDGVAVDPSMQTVYVANGGGKSVSVLNGATNQVIATIPTGDRPGPIAVDASRHIVYVADEGGTNESFGYPTGTIRIIDGRTNQVLKVLEAGAENVIRGLAVDPSAHIGYVVENHKNTSSIVVLDEATERLGALTPLSNVPSGVAVDSQTHLVYVPIVNNGWIQVIDGNKAGDAKAFAFQKPVFVRVGTNPSSVAIDPSTQTVYVGNASSNNVTVVDEHTSQVAATVAVGTRPSAVAIDPSTHRVYVANRDDDTISVLSGVTQPSSALHDNRYFPQTGYRIDNDTIWDYFNRRGGVVTFGYPVSRTFFLQGFHVQFFQRRIVQIGPDGHARLLNVLDPGILPYTSFNFATFPGFDTGLVAAAPPPTDPGATLAWVKAHAPDSFQGMPVNFYQTFLNTVPASVAFPNGGDPSLVPGFDLEMWGIPTSQPTVDPNNHNFVYLRFQRGIMHYDAGCNCTRGILLADYLKSILTGQNLPADLDQESQNSPFYKQYDPTQPNWVHNPSLLPNTNLTNAFTKE